MACKTEDKAFTLIELLIVVAIIAILAAIAVPNFLEAQTRAKVSRVASDLRVYDTAVETYRIDHNKTPPTYRITQSRKWMASYLTTPITYISNALPDPFNKVDTDPENWFLVAWGPDYLYASNNGEPTAALMATWGSRFRYFPTYSNGTTLTRPKIFIMFSAGPDTKFDINYPTFGTPIDQYDATNGTISRGDIVRFNG